MEKILISACLLGEPVRYDGQSCLLDHPLMRQWQQAGCLVCLCPEVAGGLSTPRAPAEIQRGEGSQVLQGLAEVRTQNGITVSEAFIAGAQAALNLARLHRIKFAILKARSPSCGNRQIYNGQFDGSLSEGMGVTAALLDANGVRVFNENELNELYASFDCCGNQR